MAFLVVLLTVVLFAIVVWVVAAPLRSAHHPHETASGGDPIAGRDASATAPRASELADLQAAREAKYREIRDAELDFRTGKLSREDYEAIAADLRAEAIDILNRLDDEVPGASVETGD